MKENINGFIKTPSRQQYQEFFSSHLKKETNKIPTFDNRDVIRSIFGEDIDFFCGNFKKAAGLTENIFMMAMDQGVSVIHNYGEMTAGQQLILNRQAALGEVKKRINFKKNSEGKTLSYGNNFKIIKMDINGFRKADEIGAGDYDLNIFTGALQKAKNRIIDELRIDQKNVVLGRYGGDEFILGIIESNKINSPFLKLENIEKIIREEVDKSKGFFVRNALEESFKLNKFEIYDVPQGNEKKEERLIYLSYLDRGILLNEEQIKLEKKYFRSEGGDIDRYLREVSKRNIYPLYIENAQEEDIKVIQKIDYLIKKHSELQVPFYYAQLLDEKNGEPLKRVKFMLNFLENYLVDPLLDEVVMSRFDIIDHIERGEFARIFTYEFKIKEVNETLGYSYSDELMMDFWFNNFKRNFSNEIEKGTIKVGRVGGSIFIGETRGKNGEGCLSKAVITKLKKINRFDKEFDKKHLFHEVGFSEIEGLKPIGLGKKTQHDEAKKIFSNLLEMATENWLNKTFNRILDNQGELNSFIKMIDINYHFDETDESSLLTKLSANYFNSQRFEKRINKALLILDELKKIRLYKVKEINIISKKLKELATNKRKIDSNN